MMTTDWKGRFAVLQKLKHKVAHLCNRDKAAVFTRKVFTRSARHLGADLSFSRRRSAAVQKDRSKEAYRRALKLRNLRKAGVAAAKIAMIANAGVVKCAAYAVDINGASDAQIASVRVTVP